MRRDLILLTAVLLAAIPSFAQDSTATEFEPTTSTSSEDVMNIGAAATLVPLAIGSTIIGIVPPSGGVIIRDGKIYGELSLESGVGFGTKVNLKRFSDARFSIVYTHIYSDVQKDFMRIEAKKDFHIGFLDRREILLFGISPAAGLFTEFPSKGYSAGVSSWLMTPWLSYFGFIPQHTFGITYRYSRYFVGKDFHEILLGISSAFTWGW